jgi:hypothetical protein
MDYRPRIDCSDVPIDSDDRWIDRRGLHHAVHAVLAAHDASTNGIGEVPCYLTHAQIENRIDSWELRLRTHGRIQEAEGTTVFHWTVAELLAHEALHEWWLTITDWPLGWWPWDHDGPPPPVSHSSSGQ